MSKLNLPNTNSKFYVLLLVIVIIEASLILSITTNSSEIIGGDGEFYHLTALSLIKYGEYGLFNTDFYFRINAVEPTVLKPPGYSAFLAVIYFLFQESFLAVRIFQFLLVWLTAIILYQIAKNYVDDIQAKICAVVCITFLPLLFMSVYHLTEVSASFLLILAIWRIIEFSKNISFLNAVLAGFSFGSLTMVRANWALLPIIMLLPIIWKWYRKDVFPLKKILLATFTFFIGFGLLIAPWLVRNYFLIGKIKFSQPAYESLYVSILQYKGELSFEMSNAEWIQIFNTQLDKRVEEVENTRFLQTGSKYIFTPEKEILIEENYKKDVHSALRELSVLDVLKKIPKRMIELWATTDKFISNLYIYYFYKFHGRLAWCFIFLGFFLVRKELSKYLFLIVPAFYISFIHLFMHIEARYAIPAKIPLLIFAGSGIYFCFDKVKNFAFSKAQ
jgi:4-amino-4-deoxy-L-arabinose transferase-like glycosyltransferase